MKNNNSRVLLCLDLLEERDLLKPNPVLRKKNGQDFTEESSISRGYWTRDNLVLNDVLQISRLSKHRHANYRLHAYIRNQNIDIFDLKRDVIDSSDK